MIRAVPTITFIIKLTVVPRIIIAITIATVIATAAKDAAGRFILPFLS